MEKIEGCKKAKDRKEALKEVGLTVSPSTINRVQKFKSSPSCHQDEGCSLLRNLFEFVSHDTHDGSYGGRSVIEKDQENRLVRAFLAPPACCATAKHFLPQIVLDGTFSKGRRGGVFLTACMQDGNTETVVVCIAFVPTEAKEHWLWFCRNLRESLELDWSTITFMSDRGKGLVPAMTEVFPRNEHRHCVVHIGRNMVRNFKMKCLPGLAYAASKENTKEGCERQLEKIKEASESAYGYLNGIEHKLWATYAMDKPNYGHVTSNIAEFNNSVLKADRVLTVYGMFSEYYKRLASQFEDRMGCIAGYNDNYVLPKNTGKDKWDNWEKQNSGWMLLICTRQQQQQQ